MANTLKNIYSDIDLTFIPNPVTGDVSLSYDEQAVIRSIRNLLLTNFYERPFQPKLGSNLNAFLFENTSAITSSALEKEISAVIRNFEPRATINSLVVTALEDLNAFFIELSVYIGNNTQPSSVNVLLERTR